MNACRSLLYVVNIFFPESSINKCFFKTLKTCTLMKQQIIHVFAQSQEKLNFQLVIFSIEVKIFTASFDIEINSLAY